MPTCHKRRPSRSGATNDASLGGVNGVRQEARGKRLAILSLAALGVVYGDIGTSPLYAIRECFHGEYGIAPTPENVLGVLSLVFWALVMVVCVKYLSFVLRADNRGEGGVIALTAQLIENGAPGEPTRFLVMIGLFAAALLYGDGMITPAISVLSAVEGVGVAAPACSPGSCGSRSSSWWRCSYSSSAARAVSECSSAP